MSRRTKLDYCTVFKSIGRLLRGNVVEGFVLDYEAAIWEAVKLVFQGASIHGCVFHWSQAVWLKVQALGLSTEYMERGSSYRFIRKLLCFPFLPTEHTEPTFEALVDLAPDHHLNRLTDYVRLTWFESTVWEPDNWSIFRQSVRTNNDVEGWHRRLNYRANGTPPFYVLIDLIYCTKSTQIFQRDVLLTFSKLLSLENAIHKIHPDVHPNK